MVVDDNDEVAGCIAIMLQSLGHQAHACCSGGDCLESLTEFRPDLILLDLSMPVQDGFETCRQIRQTNGFEVVPVIVCSALDPYLVQDRAQGCHFSHHLVKPVSVRQLQAAIEEVLGDSTVARNR
ncbi:MAG TPA: response regulator [Pirellulales bacterium]|nr:response regulator [Pirellulales bacterium]